MLKTFNLFGFYILWLWVYLEKVIPETRRAHLLFFPYLRFIEIGMVSCSRSKNLSWQ